MIYDQLSELSTYKGLHPKIDVTIDALAELDLVALELGKHSIDGEKAFFMLQQNTLDKGIGPDFEVHRDYLDLRFLLEGKEITKCGFGDREISKAYDASIDFGQERCEQEMGVVIDPDHFVIYFPSEAHRPNVYADAGDAVKKCVVKVLID